MIEFIWSYFSEGRLMNTQEKTHIPSQSEIVFKIGEERTQLTVDWRWPGTRYSHLTNHYNIRGTGGVLGDHQAQNTHSIRTIARNV